MRQPAERRGRRPALRPQRQLDHRLKPADPAAPATRPMNANETQRPTRLAIGIQLAALAGAAIVALLSDGWSELGPRRCWRR